MSNTPRERIITTSPVVDNVPDTIEQPEQNIACANCPSANWFNTPTKLSCYCRVMFMITWSTDIKGDIVACDEPIKARIKEEEEKNKK